MSHVKGHETQPQAPAGRRLFCAIDHEQAEAAKSTGILKLRGIIPWESFRPLLEELTGCATRDWSKGGRPPFDPVLTCKVLALQKFHGLSDDATEERIFDRTSFKAFLGLRIGDDIPDAKNLWDFKQRIEVGGRPEELADLAANGLSAEEIERAKTTWKSSWLRQQQGNGAMADALGWDELNGQGYHHHATLPATMQAITAEQVKEAAGRYFGDARAFVVRVKP